MATGQKTERLANGQIWRRYERSTGETTDIQAPIFFFDDFHNHATDMETAPSIWNVTESTGTVDTLADEEFGVVKCLTSTASSDQKAILDQGDDLRFSCGVSGEETFLQCEWRFKYETGGGNDLGGHHAVIGIGDDITSDLTGTNFFDLDTGAWIDIGAGVGTASATEDLSIYCRTDDTTNDTSVDSTEDAVDGTYHIIRMDLSVLSSVKFYLDGARIAAGTTFDMSNLASAEHKCQPFAGLYKHSAEGDGEAGNLYLDYVKIWQTRTVQTG